ncbi:MAG: hypothetical protein ACREPW_10675 [Candidatus Binataceae bacterium]
MTGDWKSVFCMHLVVRPLTTAYAEQVQSMRPGNSLSVSLGNEHRRLENHDKKEEGIRYPMMDRAFDPMMDRAFDKTASSALLARTNSGKSER